MSWKYLQYDGETGKKRTIEGGGGGGASSREPQNITARLTNLSTAISEQNLEKYGYKIGDYFVGSTQADNNFIYWLADFDTFYSESARFAVSNIHHIGIVVDTLSTSKWHTSWDITGVNYKDSVLHSYLSGTCLNVIKADMIALFGGTTGLEHLIATSKIYNQLGGWAWSDNNAPSQYISALTECQIYGCPIWSADKYQQGEGDKILELFRKYKYSRIFGNNTVYLRSISSSNRICTAISNNGYADTNGTDGNFRATGLILFH